MLKYIEDEEYKTLTGTQSVPENFNILVIEASSYINKETFGRIDKNAIPEEVKFATCLIIKAIGEANAKKVEMGNLKSQNIEGWSESYMSLEEIDSKLINDKLSILETYLWDLVGTDGKPLLYRGVC